MVRRSVGLLLVAVATAPLAVIGYYQSWNVRSPRESLLVSTDERPRRVARRVVVAILDGLRFDTSRRLPVLKRLREAGVDRRGRASPPTFSMPGYTAILTGMPPAVSGVRNNRFGAARRPLGIDSVMGEARRAGLSTAGCERSSGYLDYLFGSELDYQCNPKKFQAGFQQILDRFYDLSVIVLADADDTAHLHGARSAAYARAAMRVDGALGRIVARLDLARDLLVAVADHGHLPAGGHGGAERDVTEVPLVIAGSGVLPGDRVPAGIESVATAVSRALGLPPPIDRMAALLPWREASARREATTRWRVAAVALLALASLAAFAGAGWLPARGALPALWLGLVLFLALHLAFLPWSMSAFDLRWRYLGRIVMLSAAAAAAHFAVAGRIAKPRTAEAQALGAAWLGLVTFASAVAAAGTFREGALGSSAAMYAPVPLGIFFAVQSLVGALYVVARSPRNA